MGHPLAVTSASGAPAAEATPGALDGLGRLAGLVPRGSALRLATTSLCRDAHAASRAPLGRDEKYRSESSCATLLRVPVIRTCRCSSGQWKTRAAFGLASSSSALRLW